MPRNFHPCFASQNWTGGNNAVLSFASDGNTYEFTDVPALIYSLFGDGSLSGEPWNAGIREQMGPFIRLH